MMFLIIQEPVVVQQSVSWITVTLALVTGLPATVAAIGGVMALMQLKQNAVVAAQTSVQISEVKKDTGDVVVKAEQIHTLTNSNLSKVQAQLEVANEKIDGFNKAQTESARKIANMEQLITSLIPAKGEQSPSQINGEKLDTLKTMLSEVKSGSPPIPVVDEAVLKKLDDVIVGKLDSIQETVEKPATGKDKKD